ncbi:biotin-dependent carboxyltransferase family protein [Crenobacter sp. SG2303]|uniref:Biotin-dependent carboxyltransferase family protein n=1 Tax=Crenobacter oryzisoli TaxID=3056844 RepID=A0ABT7XM57_9NEIS|nr:biotin-dependent carboxyltransferase family protein [Crenobacter sp. SG2303]MDN0074861.1 biotin-dependent carboxyltransferase family protein [Crenobacter sp. SG2303]
MLEVIQGGALCTVQDLGRQGSRHLGIGHAGALDPLALAIANRLVGNPVGYAGLEITLGPVELCFARAGWLALAGADFGATLDGVAVWPGWRTPVRAGQHLHLGSARIGTHAYLAVDGGIETDMVLGSRSTDLHAHFGGLEGRSLQSGDRLPLGHPHPLLHRQGVKLPDWSPLVRALPGPEHAEFTDAARQRFWGEAWQVTPQSDRMGYRLHGEPLHRDAERELPSHGVLPGVVQVPPSGLPIVLLADAPTTGGYPRIAVVIEADLWKVAQTRIGARLAFQLCDAAEATAARVEQTGYLRYLDWSLYGG